MQHDYVIFYDEKRQWITKEMQCNPIGIAQTLHHQKNDGILCLWHNNVVAADREKHTLKPLFLLYPSTLLPREGYYNSR